MRDCIRTVIKLSTYIWGRFRTSAITCLHFTCSYWLKAEHAESCLVLAALLLFYMCLESIIVGVLLQIKRSQIRKGMVMVSPKLDPKACWEFEGEILVLHHPTTISVKYQAMGKAKI